MRALVIDTAALLASAQLILEEALRALEGIEARAAEYEEMAPKPIREGQAQGPWSN